MKARTTALAVCLLAAGLGCNRMQPQQATQSQARQQRGVAIIDLDAVAREVGSDRKIAQAIEQRQAALNQKLVELANAYVDQLNKHKQATDEAGEAQEQQSGKVQLAQYQQQANQSLGVAKRKAQQDLTQHRTLLVKQFREAVRPTAREVARERGFSLIVTKQDSLLYDYTADADITQAVVERLRKQAPAAEAE